MKTDHSLGSIWSSCLCMLVHIKSAKISLWISNRPVDIFWYNCRVILKSKFRTNSSWLGCSLSTDFIASLNSFLTYTKLFWYIGSIKLKSTTAKYRMLPLLAMTLYWFLVWLMVTSTLSASIRLWTILTDSVLQISRVSIRMTLSRMVSELEAASSNRILLYNLYRSLRLFASWITKSSLRYSTSGTWFFTTSTSIYSSKPAKVTVKLITVSLMQTSGKKWGFCILVVSMNLNEWS